MIKKQRLAQSAFMISIFTLISKGLGFVREVLIASKYGSGVETDTYFIAMTATIIIMGTLGSALNTTLIPIFSEIRGRGGKEAQRKYLNNVLNNVVNYFIKDKKTGKRLLLDFDAFLKSHYPDIYEAEKSAPCKTQWLMQKTGYRGFSLAAWYKQKFRGSK